MLVTGCRRCWQHIVPVQAVSIRCCLMHHISSVCNQLKAYTHSGYSCNDNMIESHPVLQKVTHPNDGATSGSMSMPKSGSIMSSPWPPPALPGVPPPTEASGSSAPPPAPVLRSALGTGPGDDGRPTMPSKRADGRRLLSRRSCSTSIAMLMRRSSSSPATSKSSSDGAWVWHAGKAKGIAENHKQFACRW